MMNLFIVLKEGNKEHCMDLWHVRDVEIGKDTVDILIGPKNDWFDVPKSIVGKMIMTCDTPKSTDKTVKNLKTIKRLIAKHEDPAYIRQGAALVTIDEAIRSIK